MYSWFVDRPRPPRDEAAAAAATAAAAAATAAAAAATAAAERAPHYTRLDYTVLYYNILYYYTCISMLTDVTCPRLVAARLRRWLFA